MRVQIYVEGGGDHAPLRRRCREGFREFFRNAGLAEAMPKVVACGSRRNAYGKFCTAVGNASEGDFVVLLVDSEGPVDGVPPWQHLRNRERWTQPPEASDDSAHLMVQVMESWFLADRAALKRYFGHGFRETALPEHAAVEEVAKADVLNGLKDASRSCRTKSRYDKGQHSFDILSQLDADKVMERSPGAKRLVTAVRQAGGYRAAHSDRP